MTDIDRLFREYHATLVRYLTRRLGDRDWAEEVAQETFVRALRQGTLRNERAWLFTVANNLVRDDARRAMRHRQRLTLLRDEQAVEAELGEDVDDCEFVTADRARATASARQAVDSLAERDRMALLLREEGLDYAEIAAALDLSAGSVGTTLSRARRRLVRAYEDLQTRAAGSGRENHG
ncbi:MAG: sigma-70 family RNA polymerase sigma factor [Gemmatimonadota bacterium]|nr:sigma-70 family RNA polymerase sigma factor [Gemmatimonadota bacterium]